MKRLTLLAVAVCVAVCIAGVSTARAETSPESVAQAYLQALATEGLSGVGAYFDHDSLRGVKDLLLPILEAEATEDQAEVRHLMFGPETSLEDVREMQPGVFYNGFMRFLQSQMEQFRIKISGGTVVGVVYETPDLAHVVARVSVGSGETQISSIDVVSLARTGGTDGTDGGWAIGLKSDVMAMAQAIRAQLLAAPPTAP